MHECLQVAELDTPANLLAKSVRSPSNSNGTLDLHNLADLLNLRILYLLHWLSKLELLKSLITLTPPHTLRDRPR